MELRRYEGNADCDVIKNWISDERTNALWSAGRLEYPINKERFDSFLQDVNDRNGDEPFVAVDEDDRPIGFYCLSANEDASEAMLKFVVVDLEKRGKGIARKMLKLAVDYAFANTDVKAVHLNVFSANIRARKCYEKVGFIVRDVAPRAFIYKEEVWDRINMIIRKADAVFESENILYVRPSYDLVPEYLEMVNDLENVGRFIGERREPYTEEEEWDYIKDKMDKDATMFSMLEKDTRKFIGNIEFFNRKETEAEWGIVITASMHNKGYGKEALRRSVDYGFSELGLKRIYLGVYADNLRAIHVYEKCGFKEYDRNSVDVFMEIMRQDV